VNGWGKKTHPTGVRSGWERFEAIPSLTATGGVPTGSCTFGDDLLAEIDGLLDEQDVLIGFWQAPGE
jgi:hypothetical protein